MAGDQTINVSQFKAKVVVKDKTKAELDDEAFEKLVNEKCSIKDEDYFNSDNPKLPTCRTILND